jgi:hypothetical protein
MSLFPSCTLGKIPQCVTPRFLLSDRLTQQALEASEKTRLATAEALSLSEQRNRQLREKLMALGIDPDSL